MTSARISRVWGTILFTITIFSLNLPAYAQYSGGTGEPNDPYRIATAEDLMLLGETPEDYGKNFILTDNIDLDPNLPGRKVFVRAVIAPDINDLNNSFEGNVFSGVFDGNSHTISHLTIVGSDFLGLFGELASDANVSNLALIDVNINSSGSYIGGLVGYNFGYINQCYSTGTMMEVGGSSIGGLVGYNHGNVSNCYSTIPVKGSKGSIDVGGLVGYNYGILIHCYSTGAITAGLEVGGLIGCNSYDGAVIHCYSTGTVSGNFCVGGLVGYNGYGIVTQCYNIGMVIGKSQSWYVGGLIGKNFYGDVTLSYNAGMVSGESHSNDVGGLVGHNLYGSISNCYSIGMVSGKSDSVRFGGLVGWNDGSVNNCYSTGMVVGDLYVGGLVGRGGLGIVTKSFWNIQTSGQSTSYGGTGKTTAEMQSIQTYVDEGWDFVGEIENGTNETWQMPIEGGYAILSIFEGYTPPKLQGTGTLSDPYLISNALELGAIVYYDPYAHYRLAESIDLSNIIWNVSVVPWFAGTFDGNNHTILNLSIRGGGYLGLFGCLYYGAEVMDLGILHVNTTGVDNFVGALVGRNYGNVTRCYIMGTVRGNEFVGELVGSNHGDVTQCYSTGSVSGYRGVGGLIGNNHSNAINCCYTTAIVHGGDYIGGLVGSNTSGSVAQCYSTGAVIGTSYVGGLVGNNYKGSITLSFWDIQTSGKTTSAGGTGKNTAEMQTAATFLDAGWDFMDETANGTEDIWWILEGQDYPRLWWEESDL